jgi:hypothetical protein
LAKDYAVYKGDSFICIGTIKECAERLGVKPGTVRYYTSPSYRRKVEKRKSPLDCLTVFKIDDD